MSIPTNFETLQYIGQTPTNSLLNKPKVSDTTLGGTVPQTQLNTIGDLSKRSQQNSHFQDRNHKSGEIN